MIRRNAEIVVREAAQHYPIVTLVGPRQSGKTTLCRSIFEQKAYVTLESIDQRAFAQEDPRGFLKTYEQGAVIDEIQHVPQLASYLQEEVDRNATHGRFVLTGSQNFSLSQSVAQSLAGRTALIELLPLSYDELIQFPQSPKTLWDAVFQGGYPRIANEQIPPQRWLSDYVSTYVERDIRQLAQVGDLYAFTNFLRLTAARTGQELNLQQLGADSGVSQPTAKSWFSILEASYLCLRAPPFASNLTARVVKRPKIHFVDSGLVCFLLGIGSGQVLATHPLRGAIFESWVAAEIYKARVHSGHKTTLHHFRQSGGIEADIVVEKHPQSIAVEVKSAATFQPAFASALIALQEKLKGCGQEISPRIAYGGDFFMRFRDVDVIPWNALSQHTW